MPNTALNPAVFDKLAAHEPEQKPFFRHLLGSEEDGRSLLPEVRPDHFNTTHAVEFEHPRFGRVRATYLCERYRLHGRASYRWGIESAEQLDSDAPRPGTDKCGNAPIRFMAYGEPVKKLKGTAI